MPVDTAMGIASFLILVLLKGGTTVYANKMSGQRLSWEGYYMPDYTVFTLTILAEVLNNTVVSVVSAMVPRQH